MASMTDEELQFLSAEEREFYESVADESDDVDESEELDYDESDYLDEDDDAQDDPDGDEDGGDEADDGETEDDSGDGDADADGDDDKDGEQEADDSDAEGDGENDGEGQDGEDKAADGDNQSQERTQPNLDYELPRDWQQKMDKVQNGLTELEAEWDDGEVDKEEYHRRREELRTQEKALDRQYTKAEIAADFRQSQAKQQWASDVESFFRENPQFRPTGDSPEDNDNPLYDAMDAQVIKIAKANPSMSGREVLEKALSRFPEHLRNPDGEKKAKAEKKGGRKIQRRQVPPTLKDVPSSQMADTKGESRFAHLDKLDGIELEKAMAKMSEAELKAYMSQ